MCVVRRFEGTYYFHLQVDVDSCALRRPIAFRNVGTNKVHYHHLENNFRQNQTTPWVVAMAAVGHMYHLGFCLFAVGFPTASADRCAAVCGRLTPCERGSDLLVVVTSVFLAS